MNDEVLAVRCPICGKLVRYSEMGKGSPFPFCSERCKLIDLGKWLDEGYRIESEPEEGSSDAETAEEKNGEN